jgi:hypothetical protein
MKKKQWIFDINSSFLYLSPTYYRIDMQTAHIKLSVYWSFQRILLFVYVNMYEGENTESPSYRRNKTS